jgi:F0F1-type ATP synthase membrane subunit b/b'
MIDFTKVPNIHYWTQRVLPCVFDESLSYVEKINKLEEEINKLIEDYNTFGQNVVTEINTFEEETTNQINTFIQQITNEINTFKSDITNQLNTFETTITNKQNAFETRILELTQEFETAINNDIATFKQTMTTQQEEFENRVTEENQQFMNQVNQSISDMQLIVDDIPAVVPQLVKTDTEKWLTSNAPAMIESSVANNVNKFFDVDSLIYVTHDESIEDLNNWTTTGIYYGTSLSTLSNYPANIVSGDMYWCFVGHTGTEAVEITIQQTLYLNDGSCFTRAYVNTSKEWDLWRRVSSTHREIKYDAEIDFNTFFFTSTNYGLNDTWTGVYLSDKWSNVPSDLVVGDVVIVNIYSYILAGILYVTQVITKIASNSMHNNNIGKIWSRKRSGSIWNDWTGINNENLIINKTSTGINANSLDGNIIVTCDSDSGAVNTNLPNSYLTNGHYYIQTIKNSSSEILQYLYNTGDYGANIYSRQKNGSSWSVWRAIAPNVRYEETTNFTLSGANPSYENYYPTTISTIGLPDENIFNGFEVQAIVNIDGKSSNPTPMLYNANLVYNANSPNVITIGFKVFDYESQAGKFYVKFRVLDWR